MLRWITQNKDHLKLILFAAIFGKFNPDKKGNYFVKFLEISF